MAEKKAPIVFKCEDSLWKMLESGHKTWDARIWDIGDDRIYRLAWGSFQYFLESTPPAFWQPAEKFVTFVNKATGQWLMVQFLGIEFARWAPGWCFIQLGKIVDRGDKIEEVPSESD